MENYLERVAVKGGVLSPSELKQIIIQAENVGLDALHFGSRQDILFPYVNKDDCRTADHDDFDPALFSRVGEQNIICSYVAIDIFPSTVWLRGTTYLHILEEFRYVPKLKINITDPKQQIVSLFSGDINFIASKHEDYWYLYLKLEGFEDMYYPVLIYTWDIPTIAKGIEDYKEQVTNIDALFQILNEKLDTTNRVIEEKLVVDFRPFPYYEGMNKMGMSQYWLGLYWRNNRYDLTFLKALCEFCIEYRVGKICLTPWKSFIIKGINAEYKLVLEKFLGKFGINVRHSALELNWHLPIDSNKALDLKKFLVMNFDQNDISTYGLTFGITTTRNHKRYFTSIIIEENDAPSLVKDFVVRPTYNVLHAKNFNPNTQSYRMYAQDVDKMDLPGLLMELTQRYFENLGTLVVEESLEKNTKSKEILAITVYQCADCDTVYDPTIGDIAQNILAGTSFIELPETYCCSLCEAPKSQLKETDLDIVVS